MSCPPVKRRRRSSWAPGDGALWTPPPRPHHAAAVLSLAPVARKLFHALRRPPWHCRSAPRLAPQLTCRALTAALSHWRHRRSLAAADNFLDLNMRRERTERRGPILPPAPISELALLRLKIGYRHEDLVEPLRQASRLETLRCLQLYVCPPTNVKGFKSEAARWKPLESLRSLRIMSCGLKVLLRLAPPELSQLQVRETRVIFDEEREKYKVTCACGLSRKKQGRALASHLPRLTGLRRLALDGSLQDLLYHVLSKSQLVQLCSRLRRMAPDPPGRIQASSKIKTLLTMLSHLEAGKLGCIELVSDHLSAGVGRNLRCVSVRYDYGWDSAKGPSGAELSGVLVQLPSLRALVLGVSVYQPAQRHLLQCIGELPLTSLWLITDGEPGASQVWEDAELRLPPSLRRLRVQVRLCEGDLLEDARDSPLRLSAEAPALEALRVEGPAAVAQALLRRPDLLPALAYVSWQSNKVNREMRRHGVWLADDQPCELKYHISVSGPSVAAQFQVRWEELRAALAASKEAMDMAVEEACRRHSHLCTRLSTHL